MEKKGSPFALIYQEHYQNAQKDGFNALSDKILECEAVFNNFNSDVKKFHIPKLNVLNIHLKDHLVKQISSSFEDLLDRAHRQDVEWQYKTHVQN